MDALFKATGDEFRPQLTISSDIWANRTKYDATASGFVSQSPSAPGLTSITAQDSLLATGGIETNWEVDYLGRSAMRARAAGADLAAADAEILIAKSMVAAELLNRYILLGIAEGERETLERAVEARRKLCRLVAARRLGGLASDLDIAQAETALASLEARLSTAKVEAGTQRAALGVLLGETSPFENNAHVLNLGIFRFNSIPSEVLLRRPDVRSEAANIVRMAAERDLAEADLYPRLFIAGDLVLGRGVSGNVISSLAGAMGPKLQIPLFDRDLREVRLTAKESFLEAAAYKYRDTVVKAAGEVQQGFVELRQARAQLEKSRAALLLAAHNEILAERLLRAGKTDLSDQLLGFVASSDAQLGFLASRRAEGAAIVKLMKATAAGFDDLAFPRDPREAASTKSTP